MVVYQRDFRALLGPPRSADWPTRAPPRAAAVDGPAPPRLRETDLTALRRSPLHRPAPGPRGQDGAASAAGRCRWPTRAGTVAEHRACRPAAVAFDVSHLGTVRVEGPGSFERLQRPLTNDLGASRPGPGPVHPPVGRRRLGGRRHHRVVGGDRALRRHAQRLQHRPGARPPWAARTPRPTRAVIAVQGPEARRRLAPVAPEAAAVRPLRRRRVQLAGLALRGRRDRVHRRGRGGVRRAGRGGAASSGTALLAAGVDAGRPGGPRHPAPGGRPAPARPRARARASPRSRPGWAGWSAGTRSSSGAGPPWWRSGPGAPAPAGGLVAEGRQPPATVPVTVGGGGAVGTVTSGNFSPDARAGDRHGLLRHRGRARSPATG